MKKIVACIFSITVMAACKTASKNSTNAIMRLPPALVGNFTDDYAIRYTITDSVWIQHPATKYYLLAYDSAGNYLIVKNAASNSTGAGLYTRIDIMPFEKMEPYRWGFCLTTYNEKTYAAALAKQAADRNNPKNGCGGFPFSRMKRDTF